MLLIFQNFIHFLYFIQQNLNKGRLKRFKHLQI